MKYILQFNLSRLALRDDVEDDLSDARRGHGPLVTRRNAPSHGRLVVVKARAHPAHVGRRRRVDKPRLGYVFAVSRIVYKTDGVVADATVDSRNHGHLVLALVPGLKHDAIVRCFARACGSSRTRSWRRHHGGLDLDSWFLPEPCHQCA